MGYNGCLQRLKTGFMGVTQMRDDGKTSNQRNCTVRPQCPTSRTYYNILVQLLKKRLTDE